MHVWPDPTAAPFDQPGLPADADHHVVRVPDAATLDEDGLTAATHAAYRDLGRRATSGGRHVVRIWNYVPAITAATVDGRDRYMAFNAGRFAALGEWFGEAARLNRAPAATGVGTAGADLVIRALATNDPGTAVQNPRQTPALHYSARYGRLPPCFSRATRVGRTLLVAGTAAITGEDTVAGDLARQLAVTVEHLATLVGPAAAFRSLRAYVPSAADAPAVAAGLRDAFGGGVAIDAVHADLCRRDLRVEIEGVAEDIAAYGRDV